VYATNGLGAAPVGTGGSFVSGTYNLQSTAVYGDDGGLPDDTYWTRETFIITLDKDAGVPSAAAYVPAQVAHGDYTSSEQVSASGVLTAFPQGTYTISFTCNSVYGDVTTGSYSAGPSGFTLYLSDLQNATVNTYVKLD
jgi:hypothetical protein